MELLLQRLFDGLYVGAIYASLAIALVAIHRSTRLINFAQGEMAMMSGYVGLVLMSSSTASTFGLSIAGVGLASSLPGHPWPPALAIVGAVVVGALLGVVVERVAIRPVADASPLTRMNVTIGLLILCNGITVSIWGTASRAMPSPFPVGIDDYVEVGGARLRFATVGVWLVVLGVVGLLWLLLTRTRTGLAFRAVTSNPTSARLVGVKVTRVTALGWGVAAGIGAMSAALVGGALVLEPFLMMKLLIFAFAAATIGGLDSPGGAIVGGIVVGLSQSLVPGYLPLPTELSIAPPLVAMILVLMVRPEGLFGRPTVERV
ncbi:MAG: branched-chain amino acid ABC transporter permease [Acidimicrobiales bacterium]